jgi:hypothetical protein
MQTDWAFFGDESSCKNLNKSLTKYDEKDTTFINT